MNIRIIQDEDNSAIEVIIRNCLIEFGGNRAGLAWEDESLSHLSDYYSQEGRAYWVAFDENGKVLVRLQQIALPNWMLLIM
ncbi:hypothetical protein [Paenibacillus antarcticus]|uniref:hypothetical protein n=1 Tax=Paenibacillus antarcticus TaxID=253703 RepID=UPI000AF6B80F|nr:hypothetical protein [Paenibacillus antarcticus]